MLHLVSTSSSWNISVGGGRSRLEEGWGKRDSLLKHGRFWWHPLLAPVRSCTQRTPATDR
jgi:hypothetical protein